MGYEYDLELYECIIKLYNEFLEEFVSLSHTFNYQEALEIAKLYEFLLKNEYIGIKNYNTLENTPILENKNVLGANTLAGGVCRHKASMLNDIYHKAKIDSTIVLGHIYKNDIKDFDDVFKDIDIKKQVGEIEHNNTKYRIIKINNNYCTYPILHDKDYYEKIDGILNHAMVLAGNDKRIIVDPTLCSTFYFENNDKITTRNRKGNYFFIWEPRKRIPNVSFYSRTLQKTYNTIMEREAMNDKEVLKKEKEIIKYLNENRKIIEEFINDNLNNINQIKDNCLYLRKKRDPFL